jgi:hypothetical protein
VEAPLHRRQLRRRLAPRLLVSAAAVALLAGVATATLLARARLARRPAEAAAMPLQPDLGHAVMPVHPALLAAPPVVATSEDATPPTAASSPATASEASGPATAPRRGDAVAHRPAARPRVLEDAAPNPMPGPSASSRPAERHETDIF